MFGLKGQKELLLGFNTEVDVFITKKSILMFCRKHAFNFTVGFKVFLMTGTISKLLRKKQIGIDVGCLLMFW